MANLSLWNPFSELVSLRDAMDRLVSDSFISPTSLLSGVFGTGMAMPASLYEKPDAFIVQVVLPGVNPDAVQVQCSGGILTIKGERQAPNFEGATQIWGGIGYGRFEQSFTLPAAVDAGQAQASYEHGVLTLTLPKVEQARTHTIKVEGAGTQAKQLAAAGTK
jgi:HSP20 family protein